MEFGVGISKIAVVTMETMQKGQNFEFSQNILEHQCLIYSRDIKWYMIVEGKNCSGGLTLKYSKWPPLPWKQQKYKKLQNASNLLKLITNVAQLM